MAEYPMEVAFKDEQIQSFFKNFKKRLKDVENGEKKFSAILSIHVFADIMKHFQDEQGEKEPWKDWSTSYSNHMEKIGKSGNKKLQFTGRLRQNFTPKNVRTSGNEFEWFNNAKVGKKNFPYAAAHDEGGPILPKRDFMWLSDNAYEKLAQTTLNFILDEGV